MKIKVLVKPRSKKSTLEPGETGVYTAHLKSPPVDGKANHELIELVAKRFGLSQSKIRIISGASARVKLLDLDDGA